MSIEAMKQALEALEYIDNNYMSLPKAGNEAITTLRTAIEQAEKQEQGEPVACIHRNSKLTLEIKSAYEKGFEHGFESAKKREWIGLTEEDKQIAFDDTQEGGGFWEFADAIEAKLRSKNT